MSVRIDKCFANANANFQPSRSRSRSRAESSRAHFISNVKSIVSAINYAYIITVLPTLTPTPTAAATSIWVSLLIRPDAAAGSHRWQHRGLMQNAPRRKVQRVNQNVIKSFGKAKAAKTQRQRRSAVETKAKNIIITVPGHIARPLRVPRSGN